MSDHAILITGAAGFIGYHIADRLLSQGHRIVGVDSLNSYYDPALKEARLDRLRSHARFAFVHADIADRPAMAALFAQHRFPVVLHLAAQAGVRYSLDNPNAYVDSNLTGFVNILEGCRHNACRHLLFASSSSVYGANTRLPFSVHDNVDHPVSLYAATKKSNELMAHAYAHLYRIPCTGLRFFTVYGPWYRPDMALYKFADAIVANRPIKLFNHGDMRRDFTYIDDVTDAMVCLIDRAPEGVVRADVREDPASSSAPWRIYNVGNSKPAELMTVVTLLETALGRTAQKELLPMQPGDVQSTFADIDDLTRDVGFRPSMPLDEGIRRFVEWYSHYHRI